MEGKARGGEKGGKERVREGEGRIFIFSIILSKNSNLFLFNFALFDDNSNLISIVERLLLVLLRIDDSGPLEKLAQR